MSGETPMLEPITGYTVAVYKLVESDRSACCIMEEDLKLSKVGGAHVTNADAIIMMIEDAVFKEEEKRHESQTPDT